MMNTQRGSAFFYILLGITLFASITYAVTRSLRVGTETGGSGIGTAEKTTIAITDIQQFMEAVNMRVFQMINGNNVSESALDFSNDVYLQADGNAIAGNTNSNCSEDSCHVFAPNSTSGIRPIILFGAANSVPQSSSSLPRNGHGQVHQISINGVGTPAPELVFIIHGINKNICNLYNAKNSITTAYTDSTTLTSIGENETTSLPATFSGSYDTGNTFGYGATAFLGKKSFCAPAYDNTNTNLLAIWQVVKAR